MLPYLVLLNSNRIKIFQQVYITEVYRVKREANALEEDLNQAALRKLYITDIVSVAERNISVFVIRGYEPSQREIRKLDRIERILLPG